MDTTHTTRSEWILVTVGRAPMAIEPYLPGFVRRNFGARIFALAFLSIVVAPGTAVVLTDDVLTAAVLIASIVTATGFLGYCEMYRALREINDGVRRIEDGDYDVALDRERVDEIGETYTALANTADSLEESFAEAREAREEAEQAREEAEQARDEAEDERAELEALTGHLELKATEYEEALAAAAAGDLTQRVDSESMNDAMAAVGAAINETLAALEDAIGQSQTVAGQIASESDDVATEGRRLHEGTEAVAEAVDDIAADADDQQAKLETAASEMSTLSATVEEMMKGSSP